ncbi:N-acetylneuraminate synthase [hydrothermal vent metagenome]|uniref:N-acetylneuraminate synthase n=1 Tax=hydrothermal vent metagenome TaxID=652676 RepID=A0A3B0VZ08_9ZZZZ
MKKIKTGNRFIGNGEPVYLIAEIGSNFDGDKERAKMLINLAKDCGADAVKFQCFTAEKIISKEAFDQMKVGFQSKWKKSVYEVYKNAEFPREWHEELFHYATSKGLDFLSAPYDLEAVDTLDQLGVSIFKIGSGDITWHEIIRAIAQKGKPIILGTGASTIAEIDEVIRIIREEGNEDIIILQCVTNYPTSFESAHIRAMKTMGEMFDVLVGYSDHTSGSIVSLGAVSLGGCVIEKHFTDDKTRPGPDHSFAMDGKDFKEMASSIRILEKALGSPVKDLYEEERETVILQRRCLRASRDILKNEKIMEDMIDVLRPSDKEGIAPKDKNILINREVRVEIKKGEAFTWDKI